MDIDFEDIRAFRNEEIPAAMRRIAENPALKKLTGMLFPDSDIEALKRKLVNINTIEQFQKGVVLPAYEKVFFKTTASFQCTGIENISSEQNYMFIANHRDIVLDACCMNYYLVQNQMDTMEVTFGSNLMQDELIIDLGKCNKMFKINRGGDAREFYKQSLVVSQYMRDCIVNRHQSVWIAQRNGRTKDGNDRTTHSVLKMFALSSDKPFMDNLAELNIVPITISYEYEPCDFLKVKELYDSQSKYYVKQKNEDINSIITGIKQWKGGVKLHVCQPITRQELEICNKFDRNEKFLQLANICDERIIRNYKLWTNNFVAYDLLYRTERFKSLYNNQDVEKFSDYMNEGLRNLSGNQEILKSIFLNIYANPAKNAIL